MTIALVGSLGGITQGGSGAAVTPAWGTGQNRAVNDLLVAWATCDAINTAPATTTTPWTLAASFTTNSVLKVAGSLYYAIALGGDAAPAFSAIANGHINAMVAEFSGAAAASPLDQTSSASSGTTSPLVVNAASADAGSGELLVSCAGVFLSIAGTLATCANTYNNGATDSGLSTAASSIRFHSSFGFGVTTGNSSADQDSFAYSTTNITGAAVIVVSFKVLAAVSASASATQSLRSRNGSLNLAARHGDLTLSSRNGAQALRARSGATSLRSR